MCISSRYARAAPSFMGILTIRSPLKIHCYTYMSFKTCLSRLIYTKLSSHRSFVINTYVITMAWRCISPWSFHRSPQRRREMDIVRYISRFPHIPSKNDQKKKKENLYTKVSSHRSFFINMYVITMAWRCISPWSFHRSLQRRREMDTTADFPFLK